MANFNIVNPQNKEPCFVGVGSMSTIVHASVSQQHPCEIITLEDLQSKSDHWIDSHSFIAVTSDIEFKMRVVDFLENKSACFFSVINQYNNIDPSTKIGSGCCIFSSNDMSLGSISIGNHCVIGLNNVFIYDCVIGDFSTVAHHTFFSHCNIGKGTVAGIRTSVLGSRPMNDAESKSVNIADFCNLLSGSMITKNISVSGTYYGNRRIDQHTSLAKRIL
jgi:carbonic anhydrase/acetyltransferase-like protein (isoleucine patch superfamily)